LDLQTLSDLAVLRDLEFLESLGDPEFPSDLLFLGYLEFLECLEDLGFLLDLAFTYLFCKQMSGEDASLPVDETTTSEPSPPPPPPPPISIDDLLNSMEVVQQKELEDKRLLESIGNISQEELKSKLIAWAVAGFPNAYEIHAVTIVPPSMCSDGVSRELADYITFCSGKPIHEHIDGLRQKVSNISISFANMGTHISIVVSKLS